MPGSTVGHSMNAQPLDPANSAAACTRRVLAARLEPFDSYWQAPKDVESGLQLVRRVLPRQLSRASAAAIAARASS